MREDLPLGDLAGAKLTRAYVRALAAAQRADTAALRGARADVQEARKALDAFLAARPAGRDRYRARAAVLEHEDRGARAARGSKGGRSHRRTARGVSGGSGDAGRIRPAIYRQTGGRAARRRPAGARTPRPKRRTAYESALERTPNRAAVVSGLARSRSLTYLPCLPTSPDRTSYPTHDRHLPYSYALQDHVSDRASAAMNRMRPTPSRRRPGRRSPSPSPCRRSPGTSCRRRSPGSRSGCRRRC